MPSALTHAFAATSIATLITPGHRKLVALAAVCSALPDEDVLAFGLGIPYEDMLGHRGLTHSIAFAAGLAGVATWIVTRGDRRDIPGARLALSLFLAIVSHDVLDALTDGGLGVAFFAPFSGERYFFPWRPIEVSPIGLGFLSARGAMVIVNEIIWIWTPSAVVVFLVWLFRKRISV